MPGVRRPVRRTLNEREALRDATTVIDHLRLVDPAGRWSESKISDVFGAANEYIRIDDEGHVCRVSVNHRLPEVVVVWLLPEDAAQIDLLDVFRAAMLAAAEDERALDYPVRGDFYGPTRLSVRQKADTYKLIFPAATVAAAVRQPDGRWLCRISMPTFRGAVAVVQTWL